MYVQRGVPYANKCCCDCCGGCPCAALAPKEGLADHEMTMIAYCMDGVLVGEDALRKMFKNGTNVPWTKYAYSVCVGATEPCVLLFHMVIRQNTKKANNHTDTTPHNPTPIPAQQDPKSNDEHRPRKDRSTKEVRYGEKCKCSCFAKTQQD